MADNIEEIKNKVEKLEKEIEELKKQIAENSVKDKKHHEELKELQNKNLEQNASGASWSRIGAILTPLMVALVPILLKWFETKREITPQQIKPIKEDADDMRDSMKEILRILKEQKDKS